MAAPQGPCPLPGGAGLAGIESRDDGPPPHGHAARSAGAAFSAQNASGSGCRQSRPEAQASRPWIHAAFGPCGTRAVLAATNVVARAGVKEHVTHRAINIILQQNVILFPAAWLCRGIPDCLMHACGEAGRQSVKMTVWRETCIRHREEVPLPTAFTAALLSSLRRTVWGYVFTRI